MSVNYTGATREYYGLFSFLRELVGLADSYRQEQETEERYYDLCNAYESAEKRIKELETRNRELQNTLSVTTNALATVQEEKEAAEQEFYKSCQRLLEPVDPRRMFTTFNSNKKWFKRYEVKNGAMYLQHDYEFYPHKVIVVPLYGIRLQDKSGWVPDLTQNEYYNTLPSKVYGYNYLPQGFEPFKMRVLFGERKGDEFWLSDPLQARDILLEIWTHDHADAELAKERGSLTVWLKEHNTRLDDYRATGKVFRVAVPFDELLRQSPEDSDLLRRRCYSEYLKHYFRE